MMPVRLFLFCLLTVTALPALAEWYSREEAIMGTAVRVELWHDNAAAARDAMSAVMDEMHRIDASMSPYKPESELSRINREAAQKPVVISKEMFDLITRSIEFSKLSDGAFDITFSSVGYLYDYRAHVKPTDEQIAKTLPGINYRHLQLDAEARTIHFARSGVRIDLGGIAKGYAVDNCIAILKGRGIRECHRHGRRRQPPARRPARPSVERRHPRPAPARRSGRRCCRSRMSRSRLPATMSVSSRKTVCVIITSSIPRPASPRPACAVSPSSVRMESRPKA